MSAFGEAHTRVIKESDRPIKHLYGVTSSQNIKSDEIICLFTPNIGKFIYIFYIKSFFYTSLVFVWRPTKIYTADFGVG